MPSKRELIQTIESHVRSLTEAMSRFRFWHGRYLEWAEQQKAQQIAQAEAERDATLAAALAQYEETIRRAEAQHRARIVELEAWQLQALAEARAQYEQTVEQAEKAYRENTERAEAEYEKTMAAIRQEYEETVSLAEEEHRSKIAQEQALYEQTLSQAELLYNTTLERLHQQAAVFSVGCSGAAFDDAIWLNFEPVFSNHRPPSVTRIGVLRQAGDWGAWVMPALLPALGGRNVLVKTRGASHTVAVHAVQSLLLRLLASLPPGKLRFTFIDPVGLGQNAAPFMHLADYDEQLVTGKAWTEPQHIEQRLADLTAHMENVIQQYLRNQYATIEDYNAQAGEIAEPYRVLVVFDFPVNFSETAARRLVSIAQNGPRCGVYAVILMDTDKVRTNNHSSLPYGFNPADLEQNAEVIAWQDGRWVWQDEDFKECTLELDAPPAAELFNRIVKAVGEAAKAASGALLRTLEGHTSRVLSVAFSPDGRALASASRDGTIRLWDAASGALLRTLEGHTSSVNSVAFSPDGRLLASGSLDNTIRLWDAVSGALLRTLEGHTSSVNSVAFSPDGRLLASASWDNTIRLWDAASGALLRTLEGHTSRVLSVAFSPDGRTLASGSWDGTVRLWGVR